MGDNKNTPQKIRVCLKRSDQIALALVLNQQQKERGRARCRLSAPQHLLGWLYPPQAAALWGCCSSLNQTGSLLWGLAFSI